MLSQRVGVSVMMGGGDEEEGESQAGTGETIGLVAFFVNAV